MSVSVTSSSSLSVLDSPELPGRLFLNVLLRIASFFLILVIYGGSMVFDLDFYMLFQLQSRMQQNCPVRMRKVLLVALPTTI